MAGSPYVNAAIGGICLSFVMGAYAFSMRSVKQTGITSEEIKQFKERKERELKN
jgi:hypothetical protein